MLRTGRNLIKHFGISWIVFQLITTCTSVPVYANDTVPTSLPLDYQIQHIPHGHSCSIAGAQYRCFSFDEAKLLVSFDFRYGQMLLDQDSFKLTIKLLEEKTGKQDQQLELQAENTAIYAAESQRLFSKWEQADEQLQNAKADKDFWKSATLWGAGGGIALGLLAGILVGVSVSK